MQKSETSSDLAYKQIVSYYLGFPFAAFIAVGGLFVNSVVHFGLITILFFVPLGIISAVFVWHVVPAFITYLFKSKKPWKEELGKLKKLWADKSHFIN